MRDLLLASMRRLVLQHGDGPLAIDNDALWRDVVGAGFARTGVGEDAVDLSDALAVVSLASGLGARIPLGDAILADWLLSRLGAGDEAPCLLAAESQLRLSEEMLVGGVIYEVAVSNEPARLVSSALSESGETYLVVLDSALGEPTSARNLANEERVAVRYAGARAKVYPACLDAAGIRSIAALARCAQMNGAMSRILDIVIEHANMRVQFGKPLAKLQAVQQLLAMIAGQLALSLAAVDRAAGAGNIADVAFFAAIAKAVASETSGRVAAAAHQILGAIGVSQEHELQHHTRALWAWRDEIGAEDHWRSVIGGQVLSEGGAALWPTLART